MKTSNDTELYVANEVADIMRNTHNHIVNGTFIEKLTPHQYTTKRVKALIQSEIAAVLDLVSEKVIGEDEELESEEDWYAKTKTHGATHEEYHRLRSIINNYNNLRANQRAALESIKKEVL